MKTLVDEIRDIVGEAMTRGMYPVVTDAASDLIGRSCWSEEDEAELFSVIADRIEREYMELPRFEDGEPVKVGDMVLWNDNEAKRVEGIHIDVHLEGACGTYNNVLKRPGSDVLDADGVPIHVGDTVWITDPDEDDNVAYHVVDVRYFGEVLRVVAEDTEGVTLNANEEYATEYITHKQPDTLERIEDDAVKDFWHYWGCSGVRCAECPALIDGKTPEDHYHTDSCGEAKVLDLLRRQKLILEGKKND